MVRLLSFILAVAFCSAAWAQYETKTTITPIESQIFLADSATKYDQGDRVAVILENPDPDPVLGLVLKIESKARWVTVQAGATFTELRALSEVEAGKWLLIGPAGEYLVLIVESDPDGPPAFQFMSVTLGPPQLEPEPSPGEPAPSPPGDFSTLTTMVKASVEAMAEPRVANHLARVYQRVAADPRLALGDASKARQAALLELRGVSSPWHIEFAKWDAEAERLGTDNLEQYRKAVKAVADGFGSTPAAIAGSATKPVKYRQICVNGVCYWVPE